MRASSKILGTLVVVALAWFAYRHPILTVLFITGGIVIAAIVRGRANSQPTEKNTLQSIPADAMLGREKRKYDDFRFGDPKPSRKQFGYAMSLGVQVQDGMTKYMISDAIDAAIEEQRSGEPATAEHLREIRRLHGVLPRKITRGEARQVIAMLEDASMPCPFCQNPICATDDFCFGCDRSLRKLKIPIILD